MDKEEIVKAYLARLEINDDVKTLEDITKLIKAHLKTFPFSSLKVLLKEEISLELNAIYENLVVKKRGGYCFEHNKLMYEVLKTLGFDVTHYLARVVNNSEHIPPQTHRFTLLNFEAQRYLIDVGIGFRTPSVPIKFGNDASISHLGVAYNIVEFDDKTFAMQLIEKGKPFVATKFDLNRCYDSDFEMGHFYSYKSPDAVFVNNFVISRIEEDMIYSIVNDQYLKIYKEWTEVVEIKSIEQLVKIVQDDFHSNFTLEEIKLFYTQYVKIQKQQKL
ncbi:MAG: arylamine N-acetyltransferase [Epsilonproteobacteria bacterium]|nr:arylamine N-acetyltransferase [Campylobacterota bacterium]